MAISIDTLKHLSRDQRNFFLIFGLLGLGILMGISLVYLEISDILRGQAERRSYLLAQTASDKDIILVTRMPPGRVKSRPASGSQGLGGVAGVTGA